MAMTKHTTSLLIPHRNKFNFRCIYITTACVPFQLLDFGFFISIQFNIIFVESNPSLSFYLDN